MFSFDGSTEISARFLRKVPCNDFFTKNTFRKNVHAEFYGYLDVNFVVSVFDPNNINNSSYNLFNKNYLKFTNREIFFGEF